MPAAYCKQQPPLQLYWTPARFRPQAALHFQPSFPNPGFAPSPAALIPRHWAFPLLQLGIAATFKELGVPGLKLVATGTVPDGDFGKVGGL